MSSSNILRLLKDALVLNGEKLDLASGQILLLRPSIDDTGTIQIGDGTYSMDVKWIGSSSSNYALFDVGNDILTMEGVDQQFGDLDLLVFGDGRDVILQWDGTNLTAGDGGMWAGCPSVLDPTYQSKVHAFFDDFVLFDPTAATGGWTITEDDAACAQAAGDAVGGVLTLTCKATTDNNGHQIEWAAETFKLAAGKTLWYETRVKAAARKDGADAEIDLAIGLWASEDLTGVADNYAADGVNFCVTEGAKVWKITASKDGTHTGTVTTAVDLSADWVKLGLLIDGVTSITPYINGTAQTALTATICDDEELAPGFMVRNGDATITQTLEIDYVKVVQLR